MVIRISRTIRIISIIGAIDMMAIRVIRVIDMMVIGVMKLIRVIDMMLAISLGTT
jgi:hypothetical protein